MLRVNRLKILVKTAYGGFGFDNTFEKKINFIASTINTRGKSSCIEAIYYCLGLEELIGGKNEKALKPVFRDKLEYGNKEINVLESEFYLEIQNKDKVIKTIYRASKKEALSSSLIRVFSGTIEEMFAGKCISEDMYVHSQGAAVNQKGFHRFLEEFIGIKLPEVPSYDDHDRKLYLQVLFSAIFIEQKRGWSDLFACLPTYLKIREPKKRVVEFLIGLETLNIEQLKQQCKAKEEVIKQNWRESIRSIIKTLTRYNCVIKGISDKPEILGDTFLDQIHIMKVNDNNEEVELAHYILELKNKIEMLTKRPSEVGANVDEIEEALAKKQEELNEIEELLETERRKLSFENASIKALTENLEIIKLDLINNKDVRKIKKLGSTQDWKINNDLCPTCNQPIQDMLLSQDLSLKVMSVDENIRHLESQKTMIEFAIKTRNYNIILINENIRNLDARLLTARRILRSIKNDIYSSENNVSEVVLRNKILIENEIEDLTFIFEETTELCKEFKSLSEDWIELLQLKAGLPTDKFTVKDRQKIAKLRENFINNLKLYGFDSIVDFSQIDISEDKLLPISNGFDMKFDSSASDNIRAIWAFTVALMQTSFNYAGNHPNILIFDEPDQQSANINDMYNFIKHLAKDKCDFQVIIGITLKDEETRKAINKLDEEDYKLIQFKNNRTIVPRGEVK
ncbi:TPA: hypothetical protein ACXDAZ_003157 [Clostridium botulinum]|uniref:hypothetical protein n=1 Tax=Clostridium botulinum TaxID=1491 RepID=UPI0008FC70A1|nr:hypothetical protein [Clostridium botulinum]APC81352.1 putative molybdopterin and thiamine biosynthesis protein [Clostridium botulinum]APU61307.1 putative molybdopterin and thiamine biosynthesis protein [Clostridium botulinum]MCS4447330.1 hypothetical protein [Clostridium botulinum]MCS4456719.1 hypothetical protein [Clostridium botulinum]MCS4460512.1 hypothetical protein [Clostridium botulinum]